MLRIQSVFVLWSPNNIKISCSLEKYRNQILTGGILIV